MSRKLEDSGCDSPDNMKTIYVPVRLHEGINKSTRCALFTREGGTKKKQKKRRVC